MRGGSSYRNLLFALALAAMGVRAAMPSGYMVAPSTSGMTVTLCGGAAMHVDFGKQPAPGHRTSDGGPCLFAAAAHAAPASAPVQAHRVVATTITAPLAAVAARIGQGLAAPPPPSTGPLLLA